jgi:hypothetical protein
VNYVNDKQEKEEQETQDVLESVKEEQAKHQGPAIEG